MTSQSFIPRGVNLYCANKQECILQDSVIIARAPGKSKSYFVCSKSTATFCTDLWEKKLQVTQ